MSDKRRKWKVSQGHALVSAFDSPNRCPCISVITDTERSVNIERVVPECLRINLHVFRVRQVHKTESKSSVRGLRDNPEGRYH